MVGSQRTVQPTVRHVDLIVHHSEGGNGESVLVVVQVVCQVLNLGLGDGIHGYRDITSP